MISNRKISFIRKVRLRKVVCIAPNLIIFAVTIVVDRHFVPFLCFFSGFQGKSAKESTKYTDENREWQICGDKNQIQRKLSNGNLNSANKK